MEQLNIKIIFITFHYNAIKQLNKTVINGIINY